jgi:hypothetical protein
MVIRQRGGFLCVIFQKFVNARLGRSFLSSVAIRRFAKPLTAMGLRVVN